MPATLVVHRVQPMDAPLAHITVRVDGTERAALKVGEAATVVLARGAHTLQIALDGGAAPEHGFDVGDREDAFVLYASVAMGSTGNEVRLASSTGEPWPPAVPLPPVAEAPSAPTETYTPTSAPPSVTPTADGALRLHTAPTADAPIAGPVGTSVAASVAAVRPHRGGLILGLGLFTMFGLPLVAGMLLGIFVSVSLTLLLGGATAAMGAHDLTRMARGAMDRRGRVLTIIGVVVAVLSILSSAAAIVFGYRMI